ncbi:hypothetical protein HYFRA_00006167 [Hymenoscyphus fraxineus]|uniref:F-box domain-containing protein n=1 Tax=Hymenoscyphus fraxineus TaxID=746836 RepID=A0A9N9L740_9HELO|nr:hypothetical protein HYFRA_00006167 [Hymenoscyphus fraxineus]
MAPSMVSDSALPMLTEDASSTVKASGTSSLGNRLPTEILTRIIKNIIHVPTLASLARTSKYISEITYPILYSSFREIEDGSCLPNFLRTILLKPKLAQHVKTYIGYNTPYTTAMELDYMTAPELVLFQRAMKATKEHCPDVDEERWGRIRGGNADDLTALLLCLLPNLEELHILNHGNDFEGHIRLERMIRRVAENQEPEKNNSPLRKLKKVTLDGGMGEEYFPNSGIAIFQVLPFLALPTVQELSCHLLIGTTFPRDDFGRHPFQPTFIPGSIYVDVDPKPDFRFSKTSLSIKHAFVTHEDLAQFLGFFESLQRLEYDFRYQDNPQQDVVWNDIDFAPRLFLNCISHLGDSLEELVISEDQFLEKIENPDADLPISSMTAFYKLKSLQMPAHMLFGKYRQDPAHEQYSDSFISELTSLFPESLEQLTITRCDSAQFSNLKKWAGRELPQSLRKIRTVLSPDTWDQIEPFLDFDYKDFSDRGTWNFNGVDFSFEAPVPTRYTNSCPECEEVDSWKKDMGFHEWSK